MQCRPLSFYPSADKGLGLVWGPYRSTPWSFRRLSLYPLADSDRFVAISALIALPFSPFDAYRSTLWSIWTAFLLFRPLSLYPLAISALSYVPFVSVPFWVPLSKFSSLATYPLGLGGVSSWLPPGAWFRMPVASKRFAFSTLSRVQVRKPGYPGRQEVNFSTGFASGPSRG